MTRHGATIFDTPTPYDYATTDCAMTSSGYSCPAAVPDDCASAKRAYTAADNLELWRARTWTAQDWMYLEDITREHVFVVEVFDTFD